MQVGIVSDSHGQLAKSQNAVRILDSLGVDVVLHCGDIGTPEVVSLFAKWPTHFVFGNCDHDRPVLEAAIKNLNGAVCHGDFGDITLDGVRIALLHSDDRIRFRNVLAGGQFDIVCYGHSHVAAIDRHKKTLAVNPGAIHRANPPSLAVVQLPGIDATIFEIDRRPAGK